jgi:hypothetical protein
MDESTRAPLAVTTGTVSAVSWAAILAGAAVAVAASLTAFALVTGLDLAIMNPVRTGAGGQVAFAAIGLIATQWVSACLGGYVTGRLRTRWTGTHTHEVFFRDTAHGLITWCVATIVMASGLAASAGAGSHTRMLGRIRPEGPAVFAAPLSAPAPATASTGGAMAQIAGIAGDGNAGQLVIPQNTTMATSAASVSGALLATPVVALEPAAPRSQLVARRYVADAPLDDSESLRKDAAITSIFSSLSMLIGAFIACVSAALGGRLRDEHP